MSSLEELPSGIKRPTLGFCLLLTHMLTIKNFGFRSSSNCATSNELIPQIYIPPGAHGVDIGALGDEPYSPRR